jgi:transposase-like protein
VTYEINLVNLIQQFNCETKCRDYLEALRWPNGIICPRCQGESISTIEDRNQHECNACRYQFSVTSGTIMHDTHLPLWKWFLAVYMIVESKKAVSANQIKRMIDVSYKTAWFLCHRIREALLQPASLLSGVVEIDESFIGPKVRGKGKGNWKGNKRVLMGAKERGGRVAIKHAESADRMTIREFLKQHIGDDVTTIYSDDNSAYDDMNTPTRKHEMVKHGSEEWVRGDVHTNGVEGVWGLFKRSIIGSFHKISHKHLDRYIDEFEFRFNNRNNPFIFRDAMRELVTCGNLEYKDLTGKKAG